METLIQLVQQYPWFNVVAAFVTLASAIAAITPTPKAGSTLAKIYSLVDLVALNIGKAKQIGK